MAPGTPRVSWLKPAKPRTPAGKTSNELPAAPPARLDQLIRRYRQLAYPLSRRIVHRIGDSGRNADQRDLADPLRSNRIYYGIGLVYENGLDIRNVCIDWHMIIR